MTQAKVALKARMGFYEDMGFSVVLCTYNRLEYVRKAHTALLALEYADFEIIIVDDGSSDGTKEYLAGVDDGKTVVVLHEKNMGLSAARNSGIAHATKEIIAFTDDDCVASTQWLTELARGFERSDVGFVIGETMYITPGYHGYFPERLVRNIGARWPMGCNIAYRKEVFAKLGGFDSFMYQFGNEDSEMAIRAVAAGFSYQRQPSALVTHQQVVWAKKALLRSARFASAWVVLKKKYPEMYRCFGSPVKLGFIVNPIDYLCIFGLPVVLPILFIRYIAHGKRDFQIFFTKWPMYLFLRRWYVYQEAWKNKVWMI